MDRRRFALAALALGMPAAARAETQAYRGWTIDSSALPDGAAREATMTSLKAQIDLVEGLKIKPEITAFFRDQLLILDPTLKQAGRAGPRRLFLSPEPQPPENPVLLHELLHVYHLNRLPGGRDNPTVKEAYEQALAGDRYAKGSYMLSNVLEYFAMTASVVLWGKAARPPFTRIKVEDTQRGYYDWLVREFGLRL